MALPQRDRTKGENRLYGVSAGCFRLGFVHQVAVAETNPGKTHGGEISGTSSGFIPGSLLRELAALRPGIGLLSLSEREVPAWVRRAFRAGARGAISKRDSAADLPTALWRIYSGLHPVGHRIAASVTADITGEARNGGLGVEALSDRELTVLRRVAAGDGPRRIALGLRVEVTTVETHLSRIKGKLGLRSGEELKRAAARWAMAGGREPKS
jgi:DNA-binding NarL/FixJ family response regulator